MSADPFGTAALRRVVLDAWRASPARFREDANAEEDLALGGYRDRVVTELAQNAADAALRDGRPGRLLLRLVEHPDGAVLVAANTGAPLDAAGLASLTALRASAKRGVSTVGRFGVGFAAVRSVADEVTLTVLGPGGAGAGPGSVHLSVERTAAALADEPGVELGAEVAARGGALPALRLPWPGAAPSAPRAGPLPEGGWATVVVLALRDATAVAAVRTQLAEVGDLLLLALPGLAAVTVEDGGSARTVADVDQRWLVARREVELPAALLADRPVEERVRTRVQVMWAVPLAGRPGGPTAGRVPVVHAPTPTDEPCTVPALLVADLPLDPSRRHVAPGAVTDHLVRAAGTVWADLVTGAQRRGLDVLDLVPTGPPAGGLDAALRDVVVDATRGSAVLRPADGGAPLPPSEATVVAGPPGEDVGLLAAVGHRLGTVVAVAPRHRRALRVLRVEEVELADLVEQLPDLDTAEHRAVLDAVAGAAGTAGDPAVLEALATLPVPLADGRTVRGVRGTTVVTAPLSAADLGTLGRWGLRVLHPDAVHPAHGRLGAELLDVDALVRHAVLRAHVLGDQSDDPDDPDDDAVAATHLLLSALGQVFRTTVPLPWWSEALLAADDGGLVPARGLVLPGSDAARWFDPDVLPVVADADVRRWGPDVLALAGVRTGLPVVAVDPEVEDDELVLDGLDGWEEYLETVDGGATAQDVVADLDAVRPDRWAEVLADLAARFPGVLRPLRGGAPSYVTWWLRERSGTGVGRPFRTGSADEALGSLLPGVPPAVAGLPAAAQRALGGVDATADLDVSGWVEVLRSLAPGDPVPLPAAVAAWAALARAVDDDPDVVLDLPALSALPALRDGAVRAVAAEDVVVGGPRWAHHTDRAPLVVVPPSLADAVADALDVDTAQDRLPGRVTSRGAPRALPSAVARLWPELPGRYVEHAVLKIDGGRLGPGAWWVEDGTAHAAADDVVGLSRALAELAGWQHRDTIEAVLRDPARAPAAWLDRAAEPPGRLP